MGAVIGIAVLSLALIVIGLPMLFVAGAQKPRRAIGQNEYTIKARSNRGWVIAGVVLLTLGMLGFSLLGSH